MNAKSLAKGTLIGLALLALAGCPTRTQLGSTSASSTSGASSANAAGAVFSYPFNGEEDVPLGTRVIVKFSQSVNQGSVTGSNCQQSTFQVVDKATGKCIDGSVDVTGGDDTIVQFTSSNMQPDRTYQIMSSGQNVATFVTRHRGIHPNESVTVAQAMPAPKDFMDFSTLHLRFSQPVDPSTVQKGGSFTFKDASGQEVPGELLVQGRYLTFDPKNDLDPSQTYTISLNGNIKTIAGNALQPWSEKVTPADTKPRAMQKLSFDPEPTSLTSPGPMPTSTLSGEEVNAMQLSSPLIGNVTSVAQGTLYSYLANENKFTGMVPITIPKGQLIKAAGMSVKLGGKVPANVDTGDLHVRFISDANGYLVLRPASVPGGSGYNVFMTFDVAITTANPKANAILNQNVLQVQAAGLATATGPNGNTISIETVGAMQLNLLNAGYATANFDFKFQAPSTNVLPTDTTAPTIQTTYPANSSTSFPAAASPSVVFSEPVTKSSIVNGGSPRITLTDTTSSTSVPATISVDGSTAVVTPNQPLTRGDKYQLQVASGIQDYAGNTLASGQTTSFTVPAFNTSPGNGAAPPLISAIYPGTPCALTGGNWQSGGNTAGRCEGGKSSDDTFQVFKMPANRYVDVYFTKPIAPSSLTLATMCPRSGTPNGSVLVERIDSSGKCQAAVPGTLEKTPEHVRFLPSDPWQVGQRYAVELRAGTEGSTTCGQNVICGSKNSLPLNPDPLAGGTSGGTNVAFKMPFDGVSAVHQSSYAPVALTPITDQNGNGYYDTSTPAEQIQEGNSAYAYVSNCSGTLCPVAITGPDQQNGKGGHIFLSNPLPARMLAPDSQGRIPVELTPAAIYGTNLNMSAAGGSESASTGLTILRVRQIRIPVNPDGSAGSPVKGEDPVGYITYQTDPSTGKKVPWMHAYMDVYMDAPDESVAGGLGSTDLHSKAVGPIDLAGPVKFDDDGQLDITLSNQQAINIPVNAQANIPLLGGLLSATVTVHMPKGGMQVHYLGAPLKGRTKGRPQYD